MHFPSRPIVGTTAVPADGPPPTVRVARSGAWLMDALGIGRFTGGGVVATKKSASTPMFT
jgi:hypothetical protein